MSRRGFIAGLVLLLLVGVADASASADVEIRVLSNRADLISGGDALVEVVAPSGVDPATLRVAAGGRDVTPDFGLRPNGRFMGLVNGLGIGANVLEARAGDGSLAALTLTNHSINGPVFSGPQAEPWFCDTTDTLLAPRKPPDCWAPTTYRFLYMPTSGTGFQPYDPTNPPSDVAKTTTSDGVTVPYIVREENGVLNRALYTIDVLYDPSKPWQPWAPQTGWNGKLLIPFQGGAAQLHQQGGPVRSNTENDAVLSRGFMTALTSLNVGLTNDNDITQAESVAMLKERIVEGYGPIRYTLGDGCSEGSIQQSLLVSNYPGLLQGLQVQCSYPDILATAIEAFDCSLVGHYFTATSPQLWVDPAQRAAVMDQQSGAVCHAWTDAYNLDDSWFNPSAGCYYGTLGTAGAAMQPPDWAWDPQTGKGVRCALHDYLGNVFPRRPDGKIGRPFDNVGVMYGLKALSSGDITPEQFVDLNEKVGGIDIDGNYVPERTVADPGAVETAYRTGQKSDASQLANVPIIDLRGNDNEEIHANFRTFQQRARLLKANGTAANQVLWASGCFSACSGPPTLPLLEKWVDAIDTDSRDIPLAQKVIKDKPAEATDRCFVANDQPTVSDQGVCDLLVPHYGTPRIGAGGPYTEDVFKCQLKPLDRIDFADQPLPFTDAQWQRLEKVFPQGICDWGKPGVGEQHVVPWLNYDVVGGRPLGPVPRSHVISPPVVQPAAPQRCLSSRVLRIRLRPGGRADQLRSVSIRVNGRARRRLTGSRLRRSLRRYHGVRLNLRRVHTRSIRVVIVAKTTRGRSIRLARSYRLCARRRGKHGAVRPGRALAGSRPGPAARWAGSRRSPGWALTGSVHPDLR